MINIAEYIKLCNDAIEWVARYKTDQLDQRFLEIVEQRRILKQIQSTMSDNPAIAAYGKSQVGKSYLMSNLLQDKGKPFIVKSDGEEYDFINQMNPRTQKTEATGVVTRFSSFESCPKRYKEEHPIMMRSLSVTDIAMVLSEGYYNDITDFTSPGEVEIEEFANNIRKKYQNRPKNDVIAVSADEMLDMKAYFNKYINNAQTFKKSCFFDKIALVIESVPVEDLPTVFSSLWNNDVNLTNLFSRFVKLLDRLNFSRYVYLPAEALLHHERNENTIMSVQCLNGLNDPSARVTDVYLSKGSSFTTVSNVSKSELSGICAEIVLKIPDEFLDSFDTYSFEMITDPGVISLLGSGVVTKNILKNTDLLDFPGARSRQQQLAEKLSDPKVLTNVLLRGKVAYLFNMYCEARMINILMYCHHNESNDVTSIPLLLNNWVNKYIGTTPETRASRLRTLNGISPLFYVATMFNIDMKYNVNSDEANRGASLEGRWEARFDKVLAKECFGGSMSWYKNWDAVDSLFKNSYLLRDFKYSGVGESNLYEGFANEGAESRWIIPQNSHTPADRLTERAKEYYDELRQSFVSSKYVKRIFENPALSWDVAASSNNDGALYIIDRLGQVCSLISDFRTNQCLEDMNAAVREVYRTIADYYVSQDDEKLLLDNVRKAKTIHREMDIACNADNYFFGHLLQSLQLNENEVLNLVHSLIQGNKLNNEVQTFSEYEIIFTRCNKFEGCPDDEARWERLISVYGFFDKKDAEGYLEKKGIDPVVLFRRTFERKKNSYRIADSILDLWSGKIQSIDTLKKFTTDGRFDPVVMGYLVSQFITTSKNIDMESHLSDAIADYVNVTNIATVNEGLVADVLTETVNEFVVDFGYRYLDADTRVLAEKTAASNTSLSLDYIKKQEPEEVSEDFITGLFNGLSSEPAPLTPAFENNYFKWMEYLVVAFISHLTCPDYNREANDKLAIIMEGLK
jgi:hypothetical protein